MIVPPVAIVWLCLESGGQMRNGIVDSPRSQESCAKRIVRGCIVKAQTQGRRRTANSNS